MKQIKRLTHVAKSKCSIPSTICVNCALRNMEQDEVEAILAAWSTRRGTAQLLNAGRLQGSIVHRTLSRAPSIPTTSQPLVRGLWDLSGELGVTSPNNNVVPSNMDWYVALWRRCTHTPSSSVLAHGVATKTTARATPNTSHQAPTTEGDHGWDSAKHNVDIKQLSCHSNLCWRCVNLCRVYGCLFVEFTIAEKATTINTWLTLISNQDTSRSWYFREEREVVEPSQIRKETKKRSKSFLRPNKEWPQRENPPKENNRTCKMRFVVVSFGNEQMKPGMKA